MRKITNITLLLFFLTLSWLAFPTTAHAQDNGDGQIIFGGNYHLYENETLEGGLVIFGGQGILEKGSLVNGDIFIAGGTLEVAGRVNGSITATGGTVILKDTAFISGDINLVGAGFRNNQATVEGEISQNDSLEFNFLNVPSFMLPSITPPSTPEVFRAAIKPVGDFLWGVLRALSVAALAALVVLLLPKQTDQLATSITLQPVLSGGLGALTIMVAPALLIILIITIILSPVGLLGIILLALAALFGWIAIGYEVGKRMAVLFKQNWTPVVCGGLGTLTINIISSILSIIPCIGWILSAVAVMIGLGGVLISQFGTRIYGNRPTSSSIDVAPSA